MPKLSIRQAVFADLDEVAQLFDLYRVFQGRQSDIQAARSFLKARFNHGESVVFLAHEGSTALGFAQLYPSWSSTALARVFILNDLFVHENGRRKGIGAKLLSAVENYAWAHGAVRVSLNVTVQNTPGQALYEAQGWSKDEEFYMYHRHSAAETSVR